MRKFFFDDVRTPPDETWVLAKDVPEAKKVLSEQVFDVMSLDHDIGFQLVCPECYEKFKEKVPNFENFEEFEEKLSKECPHYQHGTQLATWMVENVKEWPKLIIIHSANWFGARRMEGLLKPFAEVKVIRHDLFVYNTIKRELLPKIRTDRT
jgi:hypothetical protein